MRQYWVNNNTCQHSKKIEILNPSKFQEYTPLDHRFVFIKKTIIYQLPSKDYHTLLTPNPYPPPPSQISPPKNFTVKLLKVNSPDLSLPLAILLYNSYQIDRKSRGNYTKYQKVSTILTNF